MNTGQWVVTEQCRWEGNHRSVIALLYISDIVVLAYPHAGIWDGDEHSAYTPVKSLAPLSIFTVNPEIEAGP